MHQRATNRVNQQHCAKYHRMEPIDTSEQLHHHVVDDVDEADVDSTSSTRRPGGAGSIVVVGGGGKTSSFLEPSSSGGGSNRRRARKWSAHSGDSSDDLAAIEAVLAETDWPTNNSSGGGKEEGDKNQNKFHDYRHQPSSSGGRLAAFPASLPALLIRPNSSGGGDSSSKNCSPTPSPQRLRIYVDRHTSTDSGGDSSLAASIYENCASTYQRQILDEQANSDSWHSASSKPEMLPPIDGTPIKKPVVERPSSASVVTFSLAPPDTLDIPEEPSCCNNDNSGNGGGSGGSAGSLRRKSGTTTLSPPDGNAQYNGARRLSSRGSRSRSPTPRYSVPDASGENIDPSTRHSIPNAEEEKKDTKAHSGPSSRRTVLMIAGLFAVGLILILAGIVVLTVEEHMAFRVAGCSFMGLGITFFVICLILQRKNVKKLVNQMENDLYFLNVTDNKIWNMIFHFDEMMRW